MESGKLLPITDVLKYIVVELPKFIKRPEELLTDEDRWLYALKNIGAASELPDKSDSVIRNALERLRIRNNDKDILARQVQSMVTDAEIKCRLAAGYLDGEAKGREDGMKKGLEKGLKQGLEKGLEQARVQSVKAMLAKNLPLALISEISGLSEAEIQKL